MPVILLGDQALALIRDIFDRPGLLADAPRVRKRVVAWGVDAAPVELEHSAVLVSEETLLDAIRPVLHPTGDRETGWTVLAARPLPWPAVEHCFGSRIAAATPVTLKETAKRDTCWIESVDNGWLFLSPGWLLAVGAPPDALLERSRVVAGEIAECGRPHATFPAYARIASPLCASGWLACGSAAMAFDPICGDGTAHAIREAILASAVLRAIANNGPEDQLLAHYQARLMSAFQRHLMLCRGFYRTGGDGAMWRSELQAIDRGVDWCQAALANLAMFRYRLRGLELEAVR